MKTQSITTSDGINLVVSISGHGQSLILLHGGGGGQSRSSWQESRYIERLATEFQVIAIDIRGHGESDKPLDVPAYSIGRMCQDILEVADACGVDEFILWGFSLGGNIGRFLAAKSERVIKFVLVGIPFGPAASGDFLDFIKKFQKKWQPILTARQLGTFDEETLSERDRQVESAMNVPLAMAWLSAMLSWGSNQPADMLCPTLWVSGTRNEPTMGSIEINSTSLGATKVQTFIIDGLNHIEEFEEIDKVLSEILAFIR